MLHILPTQIRTRLDPRIHARRSGDFYLDATQRGACRQEGSVRVRDGRTPRYEGGKGERVDPCDERGVEGVAEVA